MRRLDHNEAPILPVGNLNTYAGTLTSGDYKGQDITDFWDYDVKNHVMLYEQTKHDWSQRQPDKKVQRLVFTGGAGDNIGEKKSFAHDQSHARIGDGEWTCIAVEPWTAMGLKKIGQAAIRKVLPIATYK
jgi:hypothetical protein